MPVAQGWEGRQLPVALAVAMPVVVFGQSVGYNTGGMGRGGHGGHASAGAGRCQQRHMSAAGYFGCSGQQSEADRILAIDMLAMDKLLGEELFGHDAETSPGLVGDWLCELFGVA